MVNKEIILSGGSVNSPQLLMLSGIGPKEHLEQFKIPVQADVPVGINLQDHLMSVLNIKANVSYGINQAKARSIRSLLEYLILGKGYLTSTSL